MEAVIVTDTTIGATAFTITCHVRVRNLLELLIKGIFLQASSQSLKGLTSQWAKAELHQSSS